MKYKIIKQAEQKTVAWSGGTTTELYVYPKDTSYANHNFTYRISTSSIDIVKSDFTKLAGYRREIMILDDEIELIHEGHYTKKLGRFEQDSFDGAWNTKSMGKCKDFNLMKKYGTSGTLTTVIANNIYNSEKSNNNEFEKSSYISALYCLQDDITLEVTIKQETEIINIKKHDFIIFENIDNIKFSLSSQIPNAVVAVWTLIPFNEN